MPVNKKFLDGAGTGYLWTKIVTELNKKADSANLADVATSGTAADISIADTENLINATNVETALQEIVTNLNTSNTNNVVTIEKTVGGANDAYNYRYTFKQGGTALANGVIDIAKDMVATSGTLIHPTVQNPITINNESITSGSYIQMSIANGDTFYIDVADLIEYNEFIDTVEIDFTTTNNTVSASVGDISGTKITYIAADAQNNITRESVTAALARLDSSYNGITALTDAEIDNAISAANSGS